MTRRLALMIADHHQLQDTRTPNPRTWDRPDGTSVQLAEARQDAWKRSQRRRAWDALCRSGGASRLLRRAIAPPRCTAQQGGRCLCFFFPLLDDMAQSL